MCFFAVAKFQQGNCNFLVRPNTQRWQGAVWGQEKGKRWKEKKSTNQSFFALLQA